MFVYVQRSDIYHSDQAKERVLYTLWPMIRHFYVPAGLWQLITVLCQSTNPLLVRRLLQVLEDHPSERVVSEGLPLAVGIFLVLSLNAIANHRHRHLAMKSGVLMRNTLVNVIYQHVLHLTPRGRTGLTSGETSTLVAVDTQKIFEAAQEGHLIWSLPLSVSLVTLFLILVMGPVTLVGIAVLVAFLPLASMVTAKMLQIRQLRVKRTDDRVGLTNSMLQGIKVAKLNNYEDQFYDKVSHYRQAELVLLRKEMAVWASTLTITVISPLLATVATFAVYTLTSEDHILTASKTFSVLLLFSALRFPINYAARFLGKAAQALSALDRVAAYLGRETDYNRDEQQEEQQREAEAKEPGSKGVANTGSNSQNNNNQPNDNDNMTGELSSKEPALTLEKAGFRQGSVLDEVASNTKDGTVTTSTAAANTFSVDEFNFSLHKGEVLAVCGPVASGKTTLVSGIIKEVAPLSDQTRVQFQGTIAYVPQTPFILNTTFRENILFGLDFDQDRYERVLDACCLRSDVEQLGAAQDLTQIGERGVTLSGGEYACTGATS